MSLHEQNKQRNRDRILAAADEIIRQEGMEALSMRYLADYAGVSLRTPYNLFGSKTVILGELLFRTLRQQVIPLPPRPQDGAIDALLGLIDALKAACPGLNEKVRELYWSIMTAPEQELRDAGMAQVTALVSPLIEQAARNGELAATTVPAQLSRQLVITLLAIFGMWGGGQLTIDEAVRQIEQAWCAALLCHGNTALAPTLRNRLGSAPHPA